MKRLVVPLTVVVAFGLGWLGHAYFGQPGHRPPPGAAQPGPAGPPPDYAERLRGRFVLDSVDCAGFEFTGGPYVIWRNEMTCQDPDTLYIHWLSNRTFVAKSKTRRDSVHAPLVWLNTVDYYDGQRLRLRDLWTGWGPYAEDTTQLSRLTPDPQGP